MPASPRDAGLVPGTEALTERDRRELRRRLEDERATLLERAGALFEEGDRALDTRAAHAPGETERAVIDTERRVNAVLEAGARDALDEVVEALARLDEGTYGTCRECGAAIAPERLQARPAAAFCVRCQQRRDLRR